MAATVSAASAAPRGRDAYAALFVLALIWGYTWVVIKIATRDAAPFTIAAIRAGVGALVLFAVLALMRRSLRPTPLGPTLLLGLMQTTGFVGLQPLAVSMAGVGKVAVLAYTMPFWVVLFAWPLLGERITRARWAALALAAAGLGLVVFPLGPSTLVPDALAVLSGIAWAGSAIVMKRLQATTPVDLLTVTAWQMLWGAIPLVVVAALTPHWVHLTPAFIGALSFVTIVSQSLAWVLWTFILSRLPAGVAGIASLATPVLGVVLSAIQLHEIPSGTEIAGITLIVGALVVNALPAPARA